MSSPVDDVAFLARSPNRVAVLRALADGPRSRHELVEETPASRVTVGRILHDFAEREWITHGDGAYETTTRGRLVARELLGLLDRLRAIERLDPVLPWFAVDRIDVPLSAFVDSEVTVPVATDPNRHHRRIGTVGAAAETARMYAQGVTREAIDIHRSAVRDDDQRLELVLTRAALDAVKRDEELREAFHGLVSEAAVVGTVDDPPPVPFVGLFDDRCFVGAADDTGAFAGVVESDHDAVVDWAVRTLDSLVERATPLDAADLDP